MPVVKNASAPLSIAACASDFRKGAGACQFAGGSLSASPSCAWMVATI